MPQCGNKAIKNKIILQAGFFKSALKTWSPAVSSLLFACMHIATFSNRSIVLGGIALTALPRTSVLKSALPKMGRTGAAGSRVSNLDGEAPESTGMFSDNPSICKHRPNLTG